MSRKDYDLICQECMNMFNKAGADIKVGARVVDARCWRCLINDTDQNPVYRLAIER